MRGAEGGGAEPSQCCSRRLGVEEESICGADADATALHGRQPGGGRGPAARSRAVRRRGRRLLRAAPMVIYSPGFTPSPSCSSAGTPSSSCGADGELLAGKYSAASQ
ncbi:hypothetical protein VPH35_139129 [Triticum aestivum]